MAETETIDLIIAAGLVVPMDTERRTIADGAIAVAGGRILAVGARADIVAKYVASRTVGGPDFIALPGFIDGHSHAGHGLVRTLGSDDFPAFREACRKVYMEAASLEFWAAEARLSALERIKAGVTTAAVYLGGGDENNRSDTPDVAHTYSTAFTGVGPRIILGVGPSRPPFPRAYTHYQGGVAHVVPVDFQRQLEVCEEVASTLASEKVRVAFTTPVVNPLIHRDEHFGTICAMAQSMKSLARRHDTLLMIDGHRSGTVAFSAQVLDILDAQTLLSHAIDLTSEEIAIIAECGAVVSNNAVSASATWGRCPVPELLAAGARVFLSSDGLGPDGGSDMFDVMRGAMRFHRAQARNPNLLPPGKTLAMTTIEPAIALGIDHEVGSIEVRKRADISLIDMRKPHLCPAAMPLHQLMMYATAQDIDTLVVDGAVVMDHRSVVGEGNILDMARAEGEVMLDRAGLRPALELPASFWSNSYDRPVRNGVNHMTVTPLRR